MAIEPVQYERNRDFTGIGGRTAQAVGYDAGLRAFMLKIYNFMGIGVAATGLASWFVASSPELQQFFFGNQSTALMWLFLPLAFVLVLSFGINRLPAGLALGIFFAYSLANGIGLAPIFLAYTGESIARTFFICSGTFLAMSLYGYTTRRSLAGMGSFMMMGLFGLVIASVVNLFLQSSAIQFATSLIGVAVFIGLTAWDTQKLKWMYNEQNGTVNNNKLAIMGALTLYLDFVNLFMYLLRFFGNRRD